VSRGESEGSFDRGVGNGNEVFAVLRARGRFQNASVYRNEKRD
jgi:hypothetical protein